MIKQIKNHYVMEILKENRKIKDKKEKEKRFLEIQLETWYSTVFENSVLKDWSINDTSRLPD